MWLVKKLRRELSIPAENVLRHYDIVNKVCPAPYVHNNKYRTSWTWSEFKHRISDASDSDDTKQNAGSNKTDGANTSQKMRYVVQCGAFAEKKNAEAMARQLQEKGFTAIVRLLKGQVTKKNPRDETRWRGKRGLENWRALGFFYK